MFIDKVMQEIWSPVKNEYMEHYKIAMKYDKNELTKILSQAQMVFYQYPKSNMNLLSTCGCEHFYNKGKFSGCCMCNYHSNNIQGTAYLKALRDKDSNLYSEVVYQSFKNVRDIIDKQTMEETITGYDFLSTMEFPEGIHERMFKLEPLYKVRPFILSFETRANNVSDSKLKKMREVIGKGRAILETGVEVNNEWIRNHWINKNITNEQIVNAISICNDNKFKFKADVIFGIPGLVERYSIDIFVDTIRWLCELGCDYIAVMPLNRKKYTLQGHLYSNLSDDKELLDLGIVDGEHTGLPWMISFIKALSICFREIPESVKKVGVGQYDINLNSVLNEVCYNHDIHCNCCENIKKGIIEFNKSRDVEVIYNLERTLEIDHCFTHYQALLEKQGNVSTLKDNLDVISKKISKDLWKEDETNIREFKQELKLL